MALAYDYSAVYNSLSDEAAQALEALGVSSADAGVLSGLRFEDILAQLTQMAGESLTEPLKGLVTVMAVLILCAMLTAYRSALTNDVGETVQTAAALCLCGAVAAPATAFIASAGSVITHCANLFLAYVPLMAVMMAASGKVTGSATYQAAMTAAGQLVARVSADVILPLLYIFLGIAVTAGVSPQARLQGLLTTLSKTVKWSLGLVMTVFTAVLSLRQTAASALDTVAGRTARFALSSFVPVVGGALSEAYRSVQGGLHTLKSGLGIFVILALAFTFLPLVLQVMGWLLCLSLGKAAAEAMDVGGCVRVLEALTTVFSTLIAVLLCVMAVFIIASAAAFTFGGDSA